MGFDVGIQVEWVVAGKKLEEEGGVAGGEREKELGSYWLNLEHRGGGFDYSHRCGTDWE